jgi:hypothetical protein
MPFFDAGSQFLGFVLWCRYENLPVMASNTPGMGYTVDERRLAQTRIG